METMQEYKNRTKHNVQRIKPIKTKNGMLKLFQDWDHCGAIYMENAQTIERYRELEDDHPDSNKYGIFWAFSDQQFEEGKAKMKERGLYKDGQKIWSFGMGGYGVDEKLIDEFFNYYKNRRKIVAAECDPQEVYIYEWNNHECMISCDDHDAFKVVVDTFGKEIAKNVVRFYGN